MTTLPPSNSWAVALAQEWLTELDAWFENHGMAGYDPFDIKAHPLIRRLQSSRWPRRCSSVASDLFPLALRRALGIQPTENPKTHALLALGKLRLYQRYGGDHWREGAETHLDWLAAHGVPGHSGLCWGYPFDVTALGLHTPADTPVLVVSAIAGEAFGLAWELFKKPAHREAVLSVAAFIRHDLPRMEDGKGGFCFGYTPQDRRRVHNANLLAVEHLLRAAAMGPDPALAEEARPALDFTLRAQGQDGAWPYGQWVEGDPHEPGLLSMVDHHHTGFVLRSLHAADRMRPSREVKDALQRGWDYYRNNLLLPTGMPVGATGRWPVDIHACAEAVLCPAVLSERFPGTQMPATLAMRWAWGALRDPATGAAWYRKYPLVTSKICFPRWGAAWMFRALAEYQFRYVDSPY